MSKRFPANTDPSRPSITDTLDAELAKQYGAKPNFKYKDANGNPIGPFAVLAYTPDLFGPMMAFGEAILHQKSLSLRMRELAILAVTAAFPTPFVQYAHKRIAATLEPKLTTEQTSAACEGYTPLGLSEEESVAYDTALVMARGAGALSEEQWERADKALGKQITARIGHVVGFYLHSGTLLRMGDVGIPESEKQA